MSAKNSTREKQPSVGQLSTNVLAWQSQRLLGPLGFVQAPVVGDTHTHTHTFTHAHTAIKMQKEIYLL